jgi:hypothetical protein
VGWDWGLHKVPLTPMPGMSDSVCPCGLSPLLHRVHAAVHIYFFLTPFWGHSCHWVWLVVLDACWALSMDCLSYGNTIAPKESGRMGWYPCAPMCLFVFPPPLVGRSYSMCVAWQQFSAGTFASAGA